MMPDVLMVGVLPHSAALHTERSHDSTAAEGSRQEDSRVVMRAPGQRGRFDAASCERRHADGARADAPIQIGVHAPAVWGSPGAWLRDRGVAHHERL
jgi:hypothetical protein